MSQPFRPDPAEYCRQVLYHLASIETQVHFNRLYLCEVMSQLRNRPVAEFRDHWKAEIEEATWNLYEKALVASKIPRPSDDPPEEPPTFPGRATDPSL